MNEDVREVGIAVGKNWRLLLIQGILMIILGGYFISNPVASLFTLVWVLGVYWIASGLVGAIYGVLGKYGSGSARVWAILGGIISIIAGVIIVAYPMMSGVGLSTFLITVGGFLSIFAGIFQIIEGRGVFDSQSGKWSWGYFFLGLFNLILGVLLITNPFIGAVSYVWISGIFAIVGGIWSIVLAFQMKSALNKLKEA